MKVAVVEKFFASLNVTVILRLVKVAAVVGTFPVMSPVALLIVKPVGSTAVPVEVTVKVNGV